MLGERCGGLVENQNARVFAQRLHDLDELLLPHAKLRDGRARRDFDLELLQQSSRLAVHPRRINEPKAARLAAEEDILRDRHLLHEREFLVDDGDARRSGVGDPPEARLVAVHL